MLAHSVASMQILVPLCSPCREAFSQSSVQQAAGEGRVLLNGKAARSQSAEQEQGRAALSRLLGLRE